MKKLLVAMLVGVTIVGAIGCNSKEVTDTKEEIVENNATEVDAEKIREEKIEKAIKEMQVTENKINNEVNKEGDVIGSTEIEYDKYSNTIIYTNTITMRNFSDEDVVFVLSNKEGALDSTIESMKKSYEYTQTILALYGLDDIEIVVKKYVGKYQLAEYTKDGDVYRIDRKN